MRDPIFLYWMEKNGMSPVPMAAMSATMAPPQQPAQQKPPVTMPTTNLRSGNPSLRSGILPGNKSIKPPQAHKTEKSLGDKIDSGGQKMYEKTV
jgi:hypothetical protein